MSSTPHPKLAQAQELHQAHLVVDLHNDFLLKSRYFGRDFHAHNRAQIVYTPWRTDLDIHRVRRAGLDGLGFALWAGRAKWSGPEGRGGYAFVNDLMDRLERFAGAAPEDLEIVTSADELRDVAKRGAVAALVGIEGAQAIEDDLDKLEALHARGVRYVGLTWNTSPSFACSSSQAKRKRAGQPDGLTPFGRDVVRRMNELGMMVDLAHASARTCWDVLETSSVAPFDSHAGAASVYGHHRNLEDDLISAISKAGGVIGIIFAANYLGPLGATLEVVADHIDRIVEVGGPGCLALGSDFDGFVPLPRDMRDVTDLPRLTALLLERGHREQDVVGYLGENFLRYFDAVGQAAQP